MHGKEAMALLLCWRTDHPVRVRTAHTTSRVAHVPQGFHAAGNHRLEPCRQDIQLPRRGSHQLNAAREGAVAETLEGRIDLRLRGELVTDDLHVAVAGRGLRLVASRRCAVFVGDDGADTAALAAST